MHVVVAGKNNDRTRKTTELFADEVEVLFGHAAVIEQVPDDQQQIGFLGKGDIDDPSECALGVVAETARRLAADAAIEMDIGGVNEFDQTRRHEVIVSRQAALIVGLIYII